METSQPLLPCKLSPAADALLMGCSALPETNFQVEDLLDYPTEEEGDDDDYDNTDAALGSPLRPHAAADLFFRPPLSASSIQLNLEAAAALHNAGEPSHGLCVPPDELVHQLEWLSSFNEDNSFAGGDTRLLSATPGSLRSSSGVTCCNKDVHAPSTPQRARDDLHSRSPVSVLEHGGHVYALNHRVQRTSRVRKARTGGRVWSLDILKPILLENRLKEPYESTSLLVMSGSSTYSEPLCSLLQPDDSERPYKKIKQANSYVDAAMDSIFIRRCTHCLVQKTPQWRAGPLGPKTLCNACGVRFKSGRLVPEYRPAASPSFVNEVHSNSHRRILEMRRAKEGEAHEKPHKRSKADGVYKKRGSPVMQGTRQELVPCKGTPELLCEDDSVQVDGEGSRHDSTACGAGSIEAAMACFNEVQSHEGDEPPSSQLVCKDRNLQESLHLCNHTTAVWEGESLCKDVANADKIEHAISLGILQMDNPEGRGGSEENTDRLRERECKRDAPA